jgi:hypothetical protein
MGRTHHRMRAHVASLARAFSQSHPHPRVSFRSSAGDAEQAYLLGEIQRHVDAARTRAGPGHNVHALLAELGLVCLRKRRFHLGGRGFGDLICVGGGGGMRAVIECGRGGIRTAKITAARGNMAASTPSAHGPSRALRQAQTRTRARVLCRAHLLELLESDEREDAAAKACPRHPAAPHACLPRGGVDQHVELGAAHLHRV